MKLFFIVVLFFSLLSISAQSIVVKAHVYSIEDNVPISGVNIATKKSVVQSDDLGEFEIPFDSFLKLSHVAFEKMEIFNFQSIPDTIWLNKSNIYLEDLIISSARDIQTLSSEAGFSLEDFEVLQNGLVVLWSSDFGKESKICKYDIHGTLVKELLVEFSFINIFRNCFGQIFLRGKSDYFLLIIIQNDIILDSKINIKEFDKSLGSCLFIKKDQWVFEFEKESGIERTYVSVRNGRDTIIKKIVAEDIKKLKTNYQSELEVGSKISNILTNNPVENKRIRDLQEDSDFLKDNVLKVHEENSVALLNDNILLANALFDSLHYFGDVTISKFRKIDKGDFIFNDNMDMNTYLLEKKNKENYSLFQINERLEEQKLLTIKKGTLSKIRVSNNVVYYLIKHGSENKYKSKLYFEQL